MKRNLLPFLWMTLFLALPLQAQTAPATAPAGDATALKEIAALREGLVDAFNKRDIDRMLTYVHPDVVVTWQSGEVSEGRESVKAYYNRMMNGNDRVVESVNARPEVQGRMLNGDTSISYGHMNDTFKLTNGMEFALDSRFSAWLVRDNGKWLIRGFHVSGNIFDNDIQRAYVRKTAMWTGIGAAVVGLILGWIGARVLGRKHAP